MQLRLKGNHLFLKYHFNEDQMTLEKIENKIVDIFTKQNAYEILMQVLFVFI